MNNIPESAVSEYTSLYLTDEPDPEFPPEPLPDSELPDWVSNVFAKVGEEDERDEYNMDRVLTILEQFPVVQEAYEMAIQRIHQLESEVRALRGAAAQEAES